MFSSLKIGRVLGINLFIHWTFWLLPLWVVFTWNSATAIIPLWMMLLLIASVFTCVVLHELGHALMAKHFGIRTRRIILSPLGGIAQLERMSHQPWEEFCIAVAGPFVNVVISMALIATLVAGFVLSPALAETALWQFAGYLLSANVLMVLFNMIPAFPMDGGRVLRAILAGSMGLLEGTRVAVTVGTIVAILMGTIGAYLAGNPWLLLIAVFVIWAGHQELRGLEFEEEERRHHDEDEPILVPKARIVVHVWDPRRGQWMRQGDV